MSEDGFAVAALLERLRASVAQRRESGQYPPNLESDLDAHFQRIVSSRAQMSRLATFRRQIEAARRASNFSPERIPTSTRLPGGAALHKGMSRLFQRQALGILMQVQEFAQRSLDALEAAAVMAESPDNHRHVDLIELIDTHSEALAGLVQAGTATSGAPPGSHADHASRIERLERAEAVRRWRPWFGRDRFDAIFDQGRAQELAQIAEAALGERSPVVDLAWDGDGPLAALAGRDDASLGGIVAVRADELLTAQQIVDLVAIAFERLAPDGRLLVSCGAPEHASAPRPRFNPTLGAALPARYVAFACQEAGFAAVDITEWSEDGYLVVATR